MATLSEFAHYWPVSQNTLSNMFYSCNTRNITFVRGHFTYPRFPVLEYTRRDTQRVVPRDRVGRLL